MTIFFNNNNPKFFLTDVFSWRGVYSEVAFTPSKNGSREKSMYLLTDAIENTFEGYKGGIYGYDMETDVHFEPDPSSYTPDTPEEYLKNKLGVNFREELQKFLEKEYQEKKNELELLGNKIQSLKEQLILDGYIGKFYKNNKTYLKVIGVKQENLVTINLCTDKNFPKIHLKSVYHLNDSKDLTEYGFKEITEEEFNTELENFKKLL